MHKKALLIIFFVVMVAYGNCLFNGFVGDDNVTVVENGFYKSWRNVSLLFNRQYITNADEYIVSPQKRSLSSGSVSYRPLGVVGYFLDYAIWRLNPAGYHLHNLLLHLLNTWGVYFLLWMLLKDARVALLVAVLFGCHPIQSETVNAICYRHALLAFFFTLAAFLSYIKFSQAKENKGWWYGLSVLSYFLAVFTKESALVFILLLAAYDYYIRGEKGKRLFLGLGGRYAGFIVVSLFFLYVYTQIFPNTALGNPLLEANVWKHAVVILRIFSGYAIDTALPFAVTIVPPRYAPLKLSWMAWPSLGALIFTAFYLGGVFWAHRHEKKAAFFLWWFIIGFLPVSNIIVLANPVAYRFVYFPSLGLIAAGVLLLERFEARFPAINRSIRWVDIFRFSWVSLCLLLAIPLNRYWKSGYTMAAAMVKYYPQDPAGYCAAGNEYFYAKMYHEAKEAFLDCLNRGRRDFATYYMLGVCSSSDPDEAVKYFQKSIELEPRYALSYVGLGRYYLLAGEYKTALDYLQKSVDLAPTYTGFSYLIQAYLLLGQETQAEEALRKALGVVEKESHCASLQRLWDFRQKKIFPIDVGIG